MFTLNHRYGDTSPLPINWLARMASTVARFWSHRCQEQHVRLMSAELQALDDRTLKDIGIYRCEIESVLRVNRLRMCETSSSGFLLMAFPFC
jgi:uncharacterized protein YjiS (DUF1127 family)